MVRDFADDWPRLMRRGGQDYMVRTASRKPQICKLMHEPHPASARRPLIRAWLYAVAALMVLTLVVGGATRLTESGLSIVEWKPVTGVLPPLSQEAWQAEFAQVPGRSRSTASSTAA